MKLLNRRDFLKHAGISGAFLLTELISLSHLQSAHAQKSREINLIGNLNTVGLGNGRPFIVWTYNGQVPGPEIRVKEGERLRIIPGEIRFSWFRRPDSNR